MGHNPYGTSLETRVLSATPVELVSIATDAAISAIRQARQHLANGEIKERSRSILKAVDLLTELGHALDHQVGGELSARLAALYDYTQRLLLDANFHQDDGRLKQAVALLEPLNESWRELAKSDAATAPCEIALSA